MAGGNISSVMVDLAVPREHFIRASVHVDSEPLGAFGRLDGSCVDRGEGTVEVRDPVLPTVDDQDSVTRMPMRVPRTPSPRTTRPDSSALPGEGNVDPLECARRVVEDQDHVRLSGSPSRAKAKGPGIPRRRRRLPPKVLSSSQFLRSLDL